MATPKPDDSQIKRYAAARGMRYRWRTLPDQGRWRSDVELGHPEGQICCWVGRGETEQEALDQGMRHAMGYFEAVKTSCN